MSDEDLNEFAAEGEYEPSGHNTAVIGFALLLIGFAAGAIAASLMTPKTGKQMRRHLKRKLDDARDSMGDLREQAGDWVEKGSDLAGRASDWADKTKERVGPIAKKFRS
jgi:gas vesicle protein